MQKALTPTENSKMQHDNTKTSTKTSIAQRLLIDLVRSVEVTTATLLVWFNTFTGSQPSHLKLLHQKDTHLKLVNDPPYKNQRPTAYYM